MLQEKELNTRPAGQFAYAAACDAERCSVKNAATYTSAERAAANTARDLLDSAYISKGLHINYRKTFIAIKVDAAEARSEQIASGVKEVFHEKGYEILHSEQGVIVRIKRIK